MGKWHLGLKWKLQNSEDKTSVDFSASVAEGPVERGFDYFYGISASLDMPPYVYLEQDHVTAVPDRVETNEWERGNSYNKKMFRMGPVGSDFRHGEVLDRLTEKAMELLENWKNDPFFCICPLRLHTHLYCPQRNLKNGQKPMSTEILSSCAMKWWEKLTVG